jgi:CBS domain-containing protein
MSQKLRKIMVDKVVTVEPNATVKKAVELMNLHDIGCLVVVHSEKPVGIVTERDMLKRVIHKSRKPAKTKVVDVMSKPLVTASPDMRAGDAAKLMFERNLKKLPVVEKGKLVGLVSITDLLSVEGVAKFLNKESLNGASTHMKKLFNLYSDADCHHRRKCPLISREGYQMGCLDENCMWWTGTECAVTKLSRQLSEEDDLLEEDIVKNETCTE